MLEIVRSFLRPSSKKVLKNFEITSFFLFSIKLFGNFPRSFSSGLLFLTEGDLEFSWGEGADFQKIFENFVDLFF